MYFSIMLSLLTIKTDYSYSVVRLDEIQAIEVVDIDRPDESGILTITLKGDKDDLVSLELEVMLLTRIKNLEEKLNES